MFKVNPEFLTEHPFAYPPDNAIIFEKWLSLNPIEDTERVYLPIQWTGYYVKNQFGKNRGAINRLQEYINNLPTDIKYYTIVQYDDGILNDISRLDIKVFGMSGNPDVAIPLVCRPHGDRGPQAKKYTTSFTGRNTHPIRKQMQDPFKNDNRSLISITDKTIDIDSYLSVIKSSIFSLCPRGYGNTSFRIAESLEQGVIPVYITDDAILPFESEFPFYTYGILVDSFEKLMNLPVKLESLTRNQDILQTMSHKCKEVYKKMYTYEGLKSLIENNLKSLNF